MNARWVCVWVCLAIGCGNQTHGSLVLEFPADANAGSGTIVVLYASDPAFDTHLPAADVAGSPVKLARIDAHRVGFVMPELDPGPATLDVAGYASLKLSITSAPVISDPVAYVAEQVATMQSILTGLDTSAPDASPYVADAMTRLSQFQQAFSAASSEEQQEVASLVAANISLYVDTSARARQFDQWDSDAQTYLKDYAKCGAAIVITAAAVVVSSPVAAAFGVAAFALAYARLDADHTAILKDHIMTTIDEIVGASDSNSRAPLDTPVLRFPNRVAIDLPIRATLHAVGTGDVSSSNIDVRKLAEAEQGLPMLVAEVNNSIVPPVPDPPSNESSETRQLETGEIVLTVYPGGIDFTWDSALDEPAEVTVSASACDRGELTAPFDLTVDYAEIPDVTIEKKFSAQVDCDPCIGPQGQSFANPTNVAASGSVTPTNCTDNALPDPCAQSSLCVSNAFIDGNGLLQYESQNIDGNFNSQTCSATYSLPTISGVGFEMTPTLALIRDQHGVRVDVTCSAVPSACPAGCMCGSGACSITYSLFPQ